MKNTNKNRRLGRWSGLVLATALLSACAELPVAADARPSDDPYLCKYFLNPYHLADGELRLDSDGPIFAKIRGAKAAGTELILPFGSAEQGARATFTSGWITFRANYSAKGGLRLRVNKPTPMSPVLTWLPGDPVIWQGGDEQGQMQVRGEAPRSFNPAGPLTATARCEDTTIGFPKSMLESETAAKQRFVAFQGEGPIPVSATPGGPAEGQLLASKDGQLPEVREEQGAWARIRLRLHPGQLEGWVEKPRTRSQEISAIFGGGGLGSGGLGMRGGGGNGSGRPRYARCTQPADLYLARPGEPLRKVAQLLKHAAIVPGTHRDGFVEVTLPEVSWLVLEPNVTWALPDQELAKCAPEVSD